MKKLIVIILLVLSDVNSFAQTIIPGGNVSGIWTNGGSPYQIQGSIMIPNGETLNIEPGVYIEFQGNYKLLILGKVLALGTMSDTIIFTAQNITDGWRGIRFDNTLSSNDSSKFIFCKIQYGKVTSTTPENLGGAFYFNNFSKVIISNCNITHCTAYDNGGGIYCNNSSPIFIYNNISYNTTYASGGGIYCNSSSNPKIENNTISHNQGGGIFCWNNSSPIIKNNIILYNTSTSSGGGIYCGNSTSVITNNIISYNSTSSGSGGGICCQNGNPIISNNNISNNTSPSAGGGIYCEAINSDITNNTISFNTSNNYGGGIRCTGSNPNIINNLISNNTGSPGGGINCDNSSPKLINNIISNNHTATFGGGLYCKNNSNPVVINNTIVNNNGSKGGALYCFDNCDPSFRNTILYGNTATSSGSQVFIYSEDSDPNFYYCNVQGSASLFDLNSNFYTGTYLSNIDTIPFFILPSSGSGSIYNGVIANWALQNTSPCIDAGDTSGIIQTYDIENNPRVIGCDIDMGAYENQTDSLYSIISNVLPDTAGSPICSGTASVNIIGGKPPFVYLWSNGQTENTIMNLCAGIYFCTITNDNNCSVTVTFNVVDSTNNGIEIEKQNLINIFPNPSIDYFKITGEPKMVDIINLHGQIVKKIILLNSKERIDISELNYGLYTLKIITDDGIIIRKILKE